MNRKRKRKQPDQLAQHTSTKAKSKESKPELYLRLSTIKNDEERFNEIWSSEVLTLSDKIHITKMLSDEIEFQGTESELCEMNMDRSPVIDKDITQVILKGWGCTEEDISHEKTESE